MHETPARTAKVQVFSCGCICRTYDGKIVVVNAKCKHHRVHPDFAAPVSPEATDAT